MQQLVRLTGIARLASEGSLLAEKRSVEYRSLPTRNWLNRCHSQRVPFEWTINPYRGCEYGCKYCYARFTHEFLEKPDDASFEKEIYAKEWNGDHFRQELKGIKRGQVVALGTATDPYQPAERKFNLTRMVLEAMQDLRGISVFVTTKSDLVARDALLLKSLSEHNEVRVTVTVTSTSRTLSRLIEPFAPRPDLRLEAVSKLAEAGVAVGVIASPVLPLLTDSEKNLESVARGAKAAGADQFGAGVLFLQPAAQRAFFPFLEEHFPEHLARYRRSYSSGAYLQGSYPDRIGRLVEAIRQRVGIANRLMQRSVLPRPPQAQLLLF